MRYRHGLVWGKFLPLHEGHSALIRYATTRCAGVTVVLGARHDEPIPRDVRHAWLAEAHPDVRVLSHWDDAPVDYDSPAAWDAHLAALRTVLPAGVDVVFTAEPYGAELARRLGVAEVRLTRSNVSGAAVRADPAAYWYRLPAPVRAWYCRRVVLVGAESTGTTTLAAALAAALGTAWVPEYGREWCEVRPGGLAAPWSSAEFDLIARRQAEREDAAAREVPVPWLVCDTDPLATAVWHERYVGSPSATVAAFAATRRPCRYVLTSDDVPFVQDGLRDGEHLRGWMTERFRAVLDGSGVPWVEVRGSVADRVAAALAELAALGVKPRPAG
ncbi:MAG TPA: AAA family ATPase [Frankiaceae bacterium]|nr:AAA family ATPase [Frankiaceae bacterium]